MAQEYKDAKIAVLIPCYNEEMTITKVIEDFKKELPTAAIYVFDNCSTDKSAELANQQGAVVIKEPRKGKGFVIESMLEKVNADYYVMVDGDDTYPAEYVDKLLGPVVAGDADMVVGARLSDYTDKSFRPLHVWGNNLVCRVVNWMGNAQLTDIMSGYRAFTRQVAKSLPVVSSGFEIETEMTVQMLYYRRKILEVNVPYRERPKGSESKLRTFRDGFKVIRKIFNLFRSFKPLTFFGGFGLFLFVLGILAGLAPIHDYLTNPDHYVEHVPLAILAAGLVILSSVFVFLGILLHSLNWRFRELHSVIIRKYLDNEGGTKKI